MPHRISSDLESRSSLTPLTPTSDPSARPVAPPQATSHTGLCPPKGPCLSSAISAWTIAANLQRLPALPSPGPGETKTYKVMPLLKTLQWLPSPLRIRPHTNSDPQDALLSSCPASFHCPLPTFLVLQEHGRPWLFTSLPSFHMGPYARPPPGLLKAIWAEMPLS